MPTIIIHIHKNITIPNAAKSPQQCFTSINSTDRIVNIAEMT